MLLGEPARVAAPAMASCNHRDLRGVLALPPAGSKSLGPIGKRVRAANSILEKDSAVIIAAFAPDKKAEGLAALDDLKKVQMFSCECARQLGWLVCVASGGQFGCAGRPEEGATMFSLLPAWPDQMLFWHQLLAEQNGRWPGCAGQPEEGAQGWLYAAAA